MIWTCLTIFGIALVNPVWGTGLSPQEFEDFIEPVCFRLDEEQRPLINGQENPLSQTLENFIALAEKFETANPNEALKDELFYFIRNYTYDNIYFTSIGDVKRWTPTDVQLDIVNTLWEPNAEQRVRLPNVQDPFTDDEKCSIYHMMSDSIILHPRKVSQMRSATNSTRGRSVSHSFDFDAQYPMELGVVSVQGTTSAVALNRVLMGMYVGLNEARKKSIDELMAARLTKPELPNGQTNVVDPLYSLTIAEVIAFSTWRAEAGGREKLATDGWWVSAPIGTDLETKDICPMIYRLKSGTNSSYSYSSVRGAADGLILGKIMPEVERKDRNVKLSQILRMYYSRGGLSEKDDELGTLWASFCNRQNIMGSLEDTIKEQVLLYQLLATNSFKNFDKNLDFAWTFYQNEKNAIYGFWNQDVSNYCKRELTEDKPEDWPLETPLDVIVVLDTGYGKENLEKQQLITGYLAKQIELRYSGSRMTVLANQRSPSSDSTATDLKPVVAETYSSACAACHVTQFVNENNGAVAPEDYVIVAINKLLQAKKDNETKYNGVNGKVVVYFNFKEDVISPRSSQMSDNVDKALRELHLNHHDVPIYALGRSVDLVKKYARNVMAYVMSAVEETESQVAEKLFQKISKTPATLQFTNCKDGKAENTAIYEDFVSPNAIQHWAMPAKYFYKSRGLKFFFESQYGPIKACFSMATNSPEKQNENCKDVTSGKRAEFKHSNPCKNLNDLTCSPFYFSVLGINVTDSTTKQDVCVDSNSENKCRTMDQIKFKVYHEGIRCSGSTGLLSMPSLVMLSIYLLQKLISKY